MATATNTAPKTTKEKKTPLALPERITKQLKTATIQNKITVEQLKDLQTQIGKLIGFLEA